MSKSSVAAKTFHFPEVRVVEASAGSGKTYALAKRYVQLLLNPHLHFDHIPMRNILAITFTNKAAFEMKVRILDFLKRIALKKMPEREVLEILGPLNVDLASASSKAFRIMEELIHNYNFFQVQTIDKFVNSLLSGCAFKIGLTANFRIKTNTLEYLQYSLDQSIDQIQQNKEIRQLFEGFLHNYLYLENRTGWFPKEDMLGIIYALFKQYNCYGLEFKESLYQPEDLIKKKRQILQNIQSLKQVLPDGANAAFRKILEKFLNKHQAGFDIDNLSDYFARTDLPVRKGCEVSPEVENLWMKIHTEVKDLCEEEAYSLFNPYIQIFRQVQHGFRKLASRDDVLFLEELNKRAGLLFDEAYITVEEIYYRLATRFHHYLIDEFQDTSRLQWYNLEKMIEEALSTGGSLFYVGDRKQAIYSFRGGDAALFDDVKIRFHNFNVQFEQLTQNWRSRERIVEFNNQVFSLENLQSFLARKQAYEMEKNKKNGVHFNEDDLSQLAHIFQNSRQHFQPSRPGGYVQIEYIDIDRKDERQSVIKEKILAVIHDAKKRFAYQDIAILTRNNQEVEDLTNWLLENGIMVDSERTSNIKENPLIQEFLALLQFLNSPIDNLAFTKFILGGLFARAAGLPSEDMHAFVLSLRERLREEHDFYIYTAFRDQYPEIWREYLEEFFNNIGLYPLYELVVSLYGRLRCLQNFPDYQGYLMHFLELIKSQEEEYADITAFLDYYEKMQGEGLYVNVSRNDAVKILTVHKSKGLEFPVVILPFLGMDIQVGSGGGDNQQSYILQKDDFQMELLRLKSKYLNFSEKLYGIYAEEYKRAFLAELNTIYVALTRPQSELYIFIPKKVSNSFNIVQFLIPQDAQRRGEPQTFPTEASGVKKEVMIKLPCAEYHDWIDYLKDEFPAYEELTHIKQRMAGDMIHHMLSFIGIINDKNKEDSIRKALKETQLHFSQTLPANEYENRVRRILDDEKLRMFFYVDDAKVFTEYEIVNEYGDTKRLDRVIVKQEEIWVVDYKTGPDIEGQYEKQIQEYMRLMNAVHPRKRVKGFLIFLETVTYDIKVYDQIYHLQLP